MKMHAHIRGFVAAFACLLAVNAVAQTRVTGDFSTTTPAGEFVKFSFNCTGETPCEGHWSMSSKFASCANGLQRSGDMTLTGLNVSQPGSVQGTFNLVGGDHGTTVNCNYLLMPVGDLVLPFTGTFDGNRGTIAINVSYHGAPVTFSGSFTAPPPPFPMVVTGSIGPTVSNITATIQYRAPDVGTTGSVYTFAVAPATLVLPPLLKDAADALPPLGYAKRRGASKEETSVACVLAQLNTAGKLQAVSGTNLQAFISGVLGSAGQAVAVINGVATVNIAGATFYVGYGTSAQSMLSSGVNRNVVVVPGSLECEPQPPQTGWWWNTAEGGRGYSLEVAGNHIFWAAFLYDTDGRSNWYVATGNTSLDGSLFTGPLYKVTGGQTLGGAYHAPNPVQDMGPITLAFSSASKGTMVWPGGTVAIERFNIVPSGLTAPAQANIPESGWWWNPAESGRGFFIEWQNGSVDIAGYMYDDAGNAVWYLSVVTTPEARAINTSWWSYANGQTLLGAYKAATRINDNVAPVTVTFTSATTAVMTLPNGRTTNLVRHRF